MLLFPNCKINLGLHIISKREDGYHAIETVFYPVQLKDALEGIKISMAPHCNETHNGIDFHSSGLTVAGDVNDNLCVKAYHLLKKDFPQLSSVQLQLHKVIPMGAGLGGGSADGAFALLLFNKLYQLNLSHEELIQYALQLGSDCPFFILNKPCFATGRGEIMKEVLLDLSQYQIVLVNPGIHVSTAFAFSEIIPAKPVQSIEEIIQLPVAQWKELLVNDFEKTVSAEYPNIANIKHEMYLKGAVYASMTGSGSTVFGLFYRDKNPSLNLQSTWKAYYI
ncbi:MAG: 4-(cytidine 5'-diphospho)-2-C-methyl-D-erythritol kinase [Sediminibacterium sp.]